MATVVERREGTGWKAVTVAMEVPERTAGTVVGSEVAVAGVAASYYESFLLLLLLLCRLHLHRFHLHRLHRSTASTASTATHVPSSTSAASASTDTFATTTTRPVDTTTRVPAAGAATSPTTIGIRSDQHARPTVSTIGAACFLLAGAVALAVSKSFEGARCKAGLTAFRRHPIRKMQRAFIPKPARRFRRPIQ